MSVGVFALARSDAPPWTLLADGGGTAGRALLATICWPPGAAGPALHVHTREDEAIVVVDGELTVRLGEETLTAGPETFVWMPRNVPHSFANRSTGVARGFVMVLPAGLEEMFAREAAYLATVTEAPDPARLAEICAPFGITVLGPAMSGAA
jgi:quercetin dioxygenase-like cupin family protein